MPALGSGLRFLIEACRSSDGEAADLFAQGAVCDEAALATFLAPDVLHDLDANDLIERRSGQARLRVRCVNFNNLVSLVPSDQRLDADFVHLNADTLWLIQLAWEHGPRSGEYAVELGTGNGIVAAHLVARFRRVLATDLPGPWMHFAQLTLEANRARGRPSAVVASDVATALRPGVFDLVVANSPWSPAVPVDDQGRDVTFMSGGPTGTELPGRFLCEGAALLRPGGTAIVLCMDPTFDDGRRPLQPILDDLRHRGFDVDVVDSPVFDATMMTERLRAKRLADLAHARHVAVVIRRSCA